MAAVVGALRAVLSLESAAFIEGISRAQRALGNFDRRMQRIGGGLQKVGAGLSVVGAGIAAAVRGQINAADEMGKAAQKFGVPIEELSRLNYAAGLSDVSLETLGTSLGKLSKQMVAATEGGAAADLFERIGVSATDASGALRPTEAVFADISDVFGSMEDGAEKTALAMELFGRSGAEIIPLLNAGKQSIEDMAREANELGLVITPEMADNAEDFNDNLVRLGSLAKGIALQVADKLAPALARLTEWLLEVSKGFRNLSPETVEFLAKAATVTVVIGPAVVALGTLLGSLGSIAKTMLTAGIVAKAILVPALAGIGVAATVLATAATSIIIPALSAIGAAAAVAATAMRAVAVALLTNPIVLAGAAIAGIAVIVYQNWEPIAAFFTELWAGISQTFTDTWEGIKSTVSGAIEYIKGKFNEFIAVIDGAIQRAVELGKKIAEALGFRDQLQDARARGDAILPDGSINYETGRGLGNDVVRGLADGIGAGVEENKADIRAYLEGVTETANETFDRNSPSRVFAAIGRDLMAGLGVGVREGAGLATGAVSEVGADITAAAGNLTLGADDFKSAWGSAFTSFVTGTASLKSALSGLAAQMAQTFANSAFERLWDGSGGAGSGGGLGAIIGSVFGFAKGGVFQGGRVQPFAKGGVISGATAFAMQSGLGVMGEAGPEAIMPLTRGAGGKLGVMAAGGGQVVRVIVEEGPMFAARVRSMSEGVAVEVARASIEHYDANVLPSSVTAISNDPRKTGG